MAFSSSLFRVLVVAGLFTVIFLLTPTYISASNQSGVLPSRGIDAIGESGMDIHAASFLENAFGDRSTPWLAYIALLATIGLGLAINMSRERNVKSGYRITEDNS